MADEIHEGDIGTVIRSTIKEKGVAISLAGAATQEYILEKPDGTTVAKTTTFTTEPGTDGVVEWTSAVAADLTPAGTWKLQFHWITATAEDWRSNLAGFTVHPNLTIPS